MTEGSSLNVETVQRRLEAIKERLDELGGLGEVTIERLRGDWLVRAAIERVVIELVEYAAQINAHVIAASDKLPPNGYRQSFAAMAEIGILPAELATRIAPSAGLRNILVHQYLDADLAIVARSVPMVVNDYGAYVREVAGWLSRRAQT